jgi:NitT/TauT family transport system permease protein
MPSSTAQSSTTAPDEEPTRQELAQETRRLSELNAGLDALETTDLMRRPITHGVVRMLSPLLAIAIVVLIWQVLTWMRWQPEWVLPSPQGVWNALWAQYEQDILVDSVLNSIRRAAWGFLISIAIATPIGLALGLVKPLRAIFGPILVGLQQLPSVAWVPAAIIWFGLSDATIYAVVLLGAIPSITNGLLAGMDQIPPIYLRAGDVLGARGFNRIVRIVLPAAWPGYLAGLEQGWAFAWRSLMAAELIAVSPALGLGVGQMLDIGRQLGDMALVIGSILVILFVGVLVERVVFNPIRTRTLRNRGLMR